MALNAGAKLGRYEILSPIGAGGMGEVYRARDSQLGRDVAIKVLPESLAGDPERLRRFEQEARSVGALNHPNILSVYDIGLNNGTPFMVAELLRGVTLREKINSGPLSPKRAMDYAHQVANGLAAAHEQGITHRDLKPENLFITNDGRVKILDFGLAKQNAEGARANDLTATVAESTLTSEGMVLGTAGYMSPEQVRGQAVDPRTDIFALGTVLYEMLSARRPFGGNSTIETMNAILKEEPPEFSTTDKQIPPALDRLMRRCLEKDREQRFQSAKDLTFALDSISAGTGQLQAIPVSSTARKVGPIAIAAALAVAVIAALVVSLMRPREQPKFRQLTFRKGYLQVARFTPDRQTIVYSAAWDQHAAKLYSSRADGMDPRPLDLPPGQLLAISRTGELAMLLNGDSWIGLGGRLARVPISGGAPHELLENVIAADWSPDGSQLAVARFEKGKCRLEYPTGKVLYENVGYITSLRFSPQGDAIAFMDHPILGDDRGTAVMLDLRTGKKLVTNEWEGEQGLAWAPDGREFWITATSGRDSERTLYGITRSGRQREILRVPGGLFLNDVAEDGRTLLTIYDRDFEVIAGENGGTNRQISWLQIMVASSVSRDGKFVAIGDWGGTNGPEYSVYLAKLDGSPAILLGSGIAGSLSPDNKWVTSILPGNTDRIALLPTGIGETKIVAAHDFQYRNAFWTSDGHKLIVRASQSGRPLRFWLQDLEGGAPRALTAEGVSGVVVSIRGTDYVCARDADGKTHLLPIAGGDSKEVNGISENDLILGGPSAGDNLYVIPNSSPSEVAAGITLEIPLQIAKVNIATGKREAVLSLSPSNSTGVVFLLPPLLTSDEKHYVYTQSRISTTLYSATGLR